MDTFEERLKWLRKSQGYSQQSLADTAEVSRSSICGFETGRSLPSSQTLTLLASALRCSLDYLMTGRESPFPPIEQTPGRRPEAEPPSEGPQAEVVRLLRPDRTEARPRRSAERSPSTIRSSSRPRRSRGV